MRPDEVNDDFCVFLFKFIENVQVANGVCKINSKII